MTEKLFTGTLNHNKNKTKNKSRISTVREKVREKCFKVRELSGNFVISHGISEISIKSEESQGILK